MANGVICCSVCTVHEIQSCCICRFPLPTTCALAECRDAHGIKHGGFHYFLPITAQERITERNHNYFNHKLLDLQSAQLKLKESLHLLDNVIVQIEDTYQRKVATFAELKDLYIVRVNRLKETATEAFNAAIRETTENAINCEYAPQNEIAQWICKPAENQPGEVIPLFQSEIREGQEEEALLLSVMVKSVFSSLASWHIDFPEDKNARQKEELERLKMTNEELGRKLKEVESHCQSLSMELKTSQNTIEKLNTELQKKTFANSRGRTSSPLLPKKVYRLNDTFRHVQFLNTTLSPQKTINEFNLRCQSPYQEQRLKPYLQMRKRSVDVGVKKKVVPDAVVISHKQESMKKAKMELEQRKSLGESQCLKVSSERHFLSRVLSNAGFSSKKPEADYQIFHQKPKKFQKVERLETPLNQEQESSTPDAKSKLNSSFHHIQPLSDLSLNSREGEDFIQTQLTFGGQGKRCKICDFTLNPDDANLQCPNSCLCKLCVIEHILALKVQHCKHCGTSFNWELVMAAERCAKQCHICGIALPHKEFPINATCNVCLFCVEITGNAAKCLKCKTESFNITEEEMERIQGKMSENACGCKESESLFHWVLPCGHRVCKVHVSTLLVCRVCKYPTQ